MSDSESLRSLANELDELRDRLSLLQGKVSVYSRPLAREFNSPSGALLGVVRELEVMSIESLVREHRARFGIAEPPKGTA